MEENNNMKWSISRIISAVVLVLIVLGAIAYGIYSLTQSSSPSHNQTATTTHLTAPSPNTKSKSSSKNKTNAAANKQPVASANTAPSTTNQPSSSTVSGSSKQLTNTGPGETALYGFILASIIGYSIHFFWRKIQNS